MPKLFAHFRKENIVTDYYLLDWYMTMFSRTLRFVQNSIALSMCDQSRATVFRPPVASGIVFCSKANKFSVKYARADSSVSLSEIIDRQAALGILRLCDHRLLQLEFEDCGASRLPLRSVFALNRKTTLQFANCVDCRARSMPPS